MPVLRDVLRNSSDAEHRAIAAYIIGYVSKKRDVVSDLQQGIQDPDDGVRYNAIRAMNAISVLAAQNPEIGLIAAEVFENGICSLLSRLAPDETATPVPRWPGISCMPTARSYSPIQHIRICWMASTCPVCRCSTCPASRCWRTRFLLRR